MKANEFIKELTSSTNDKKLNILIISCYEKEFNKYINKLLVGSKVITISDADALTEVAEAKAKINHQLNKILNESSSDMILSYQKTIFQLEESIGFWENANESSYFSQTSYTKNILHWHLVIRHMRIMNS